MRKYGLPIPGQIFLGRKGHKNPQGSVTPQPSFSYEEAGPREALSSRDSDLSHDLPASKLPEDRKEPSCSSIPIWDAALDEMPQAPGEPQEPSYLGGRQEPVPEVDGRKVRRPSDEEWKTTQFLEKQETIYGHKLKIASSRTRSNSRGWGRPRGSRNRGCKRGSGTTSGMPWTVSQEETSGHVSKYLSYV